MLLTIDAPLSLLHQVYLKREMEEEGAPNATCAGCCCGAANRCALSPRGRTYSCGRACRLDFRSKLREGCSYEKQWRMATAFSGDTLTRMEGSAATQSRPASDPTFRSCNQHGTFSNTAHLTSWAGVGWVGSHTMESFTFGTLDSYRAYQAIMAARAGAVSPHPPSHPA
jgi:hypothetical protein